MRKKRLTLSTTQIIMLSFLIVMLVGSILLSLPISSADGESVPFEDALFTATTATCVTGLVTVPTATAWSMFGQIVILVLIQVGGLGTITIMSTILLIFHKKMGIGDRLLIQDAFNLNTLSGLIRFVKKVVYGTLIIECVGALLYMLVFVPQFGLRGVWISVFNSVSAFCNAGMDIISDNSLCNYATDPIINGVTCTLIVLGGLGYIVWWDLLCVIKDIRRQGVKCFRKLTLHSKITLSMTAILIIGGAITFFALENNNPLTIGEFSVWDKLQISVFQSVTTRTAGFATVAQENLTDVSAAVSLLLMFIGGSPVGTAGGVKTVTIAVIIASSIATIRNRNDAVLFNRTISRASVNKALAVVTMAFAIMFVSTLMLSLVTDASLLDVIYETISATATVGLSRNLTASLGICGKLIIIATMYLGRVGPISLAIAFNIKKINKNIIKNPAEDISVG